MDQKTSRVAPLNTTASNLGALPALRAALLLMILCGGIYPVVTTVIGAVLFPERSMGSLIFWDGQAVGSALVGQPFESERYFYGRPSVADHRPFRLSGSNLAASNPELRARVRSRAEGIAKREGVSMTEIPVDLLAASGSGIDPHISPAAAAIQVERVARSRGIAVARVRQLVAVHTEPPALGILGQPRVHVLRLNLALDASGDDDIANGAER